MMIEVENMMIHGRNCIHPHQGDTRSPIVSGFKNKLLSDSNFRSSLQNHHDVYFSNISSLMPNQFGYRAALHNYLNRAGHMFSSNIDKTNFETSLKNYNAKNTVNINIELTDNDLSVLRTENAQITKGSHIIQNQDGKLNIYRAGSLNVSVEDALNFHKEAIYSVSSSLRAGRHGGQTPGVIIASFLVA